MSERVSVAIESVRLPQGIKLVLTAQDGSLRRWSKLYDADLFMAMDCMGLGLLGAVPVLDRGAVVRERTGLRKEAEIEVERLTSFAPSV